MYLKKIVSGNNTYYSIARSYQDEKGRIQTEYIQKFGKLDLETGKLEIVIPEAGLISSTIG